MITSTNITLLGIDNNAERYLWAAYHIFVFLSSFIGDTLIIVASLKDRIKVNNSVVTIIQHIAICDLSLSIVQVLPTATSLISNFWVLGDVMCYVKVYVSYLVHTAGMCFIALLTTNKLLILKNPPSPAVSLWDLRVKIACIFIWVVCSGFPLCFLVLDRTDVHFDYRIYVCDYRFTADVWRTLLPIMSILYILAPNIIIITTTIPTLKYLLAARKSAQRVGGSVPWHGALTVVLTAIVFLISNLPMSVYYIGANFVTDPIGPFRLHLHRISHYMSMINIMSNFFIYTLTIPSFRRYILSRGRSVVSVSSGQNTSFEKRSRSKDKTATAV